MGTRRCYLDIETAGTGFGSCQITVIGLGLEGPNGIEVIQLVGHHVTDLALHRVLDEAGRVYTYNGTRFDLPVIRRGLGVDVAGRVPHHDLMYDCWRCGLKGGLKAVERRLGIERQTQGIDGRMAMRLWWDYVLHDDHDALHTLLLYNREDVTNLALLRTRLGVD
ncbi:MAG TPA: exonuclease [Phycisphaerales bacterium]|nr:exonuclease [Phycisphaerales bacterium]